MGFGEKVAYHPDRDEIIERLLSGESVNNVADWLKAKYPNKKRHQISYLTLQRYRKDHLKLQGQVLREIKQTTHALTAERVETQREAALVESEPYQAAKLRIAQDVLSREQLILDIQDKCWQRIKMLESEELNYKTETVLVQYIGELRQLMSDYHRMLVDMEKLEKKGNNSQVNVQVVMQEAEEQVNAMKVVVKEVLQEMSPELIPLFLERIKEKLEEQEKRSSGSTVNVQVNNYA